MKSNKVGVVVGKIDENQKFTISFEEVETGSEKEQAIFGNGINAGINNLLTQLGELMEKNQGHFCFLGNCNSKLQICASEPQDDMDDYLEKMTKAILGAFVAQTEYIIPLYRAMLGAVLAAPSYNKDLLPHTQQILKFFGEQFGIDVDSSAFKEMMSENPKRN